MNVKRLQHVSIPVPHGAADVARQFYGGVLGLREKRVPRELDAAMLTWFAVGEDEDELHCFVDPDYTNRCTAQHLCFEVKDLSALEEVIRTAGIPFDHVPATIRNRPRAFVRDPFGNLIELTQIDGPYEED